MTASYSEGSYSHGKVTHDHGEPAISEDALRVVDVHVVVFGIREDAEEVREDRNNGDQTSEGVHDQRLLPEPESSQGDQAESPRQRHEHILLHNVGAGGDRGAVLAVPLLVLVENKARVDELEQAHSEEAGRPHHHWLHLIYYTPSMRLLLLLTGSVASIKASELFTLLSSFASLTGMPLHASARHGGSPSLPRHCSVAP